MCSFSSLENGSVMKESDHDPVKLNSNCRKCKDVLANVILQQKFPYCRSCFLEFVNHKFFGSLGKTKLMRREDKVLILSSGSQASMALIHLVETGMFKRQKKILSSAYVVYIDDSCVLPLSFEEKIDRIEHIRAVLCHTKINAIVAPLDYKKGTFYRLEDIHWYNQDYVKQHSIPKKWGSLSASAKEDLLVKLRTLAAAQIAQDLGCNKIFMGDTSDSIAKLILSNVALGRGGQLALDTGLMDSRFPDVLFMRPLRECSKKEVAFYCHFNELQYVTLPKLGTGEPKNFSIQKLTEVFVADLMKSYLSTVTTVISTGNKLRMANEKSDTDKICPLCKTVVACPSGELSSEDSSNISHLISTLGSNYFDPKLLRPIKDTEISGDSTCTDCSCLKEKTKEHTSFQNIIRNFCYSCSRIVMKLDNLDEVLPSGVIEDANAQSALHRMKDEIKDFLL